MGKVRIKLQSVDIDKLNEVINKIREIAEKTAPTKATLSCQANFVKSGIFISIIIYRVTTNWLKV